MFDEGLLSAIRFSPVIHLVAAMRRIGLLSEEGLSFTRDAWDGVLVDDTMSWPSLHQINVRSSAGCRLPALGHH